MAIDRVFFDTDVLIDFLIARKPFSEDAAKLFTYAEKGHLEVCVSSLSFNNVYYVIRRLENEQKARASLENLERLTQILAVGQKNIKQALLSTFKDFEDGVQNFCASEEGLQTIVTRNIKDYSNSALAVLTPTDYLKVFEKKMNQLE